MRCNCLGQREVKLLEISIVYNYKERKIVAIRKDIHEWQTLLERRKMQQCAVQECIMKSRDRDKENQSSYSFGSDSLHRICFLTTTYTKIKPNARQEYMIVVSRLAILKL